VALATPSWGARNEGIRGRTRARVCSGVDEALRAALAHTHDRVIVSCSSAVARLMRVCLAPLPALPAARLSLRAWPGVHQRCGASACPSSPLVATTSREGGAQARPFLFERDESRTPTRVNCRRAPRTRATAAPQAARRRAVMSRAAQRATRAPA
jgi:hypothetical protein